MSEHTDTFFKQNSGITSYSYDTVFMQVAL